MFRLETATDRETGATWWHKVYRDEELVFAAYALTTGEWMIGLETVDEATMAGRLLAATVRAAVR